MGASECTPLTCSVSATDFARATGLVGTKQLLIGDTLVLTCEIGYGTDPRDKTSKDVQVTCTDKDGFGVAAVSGVCQEFACDPVSSIGGGYPVKVPRAGACGDEKWLHGTTCSFACGQGSQLTNPDFTHATCDKGQLSMCTGEECVEQSPASKSTPGCVARGTTVAAEEIVRSAATIVLDSGRRLSEKSDLLISVEENLASVLAAFRVAMERTLNLAQGQVKLEDHSLGEDGAGVVLVCQFYVPRSGDVEAHLAAFASGDADMTEQLATALANELDKGVVTFTVGKVRVTQPKRGTVYVESTKPPPAPVAEEPGLLDRIDMVVVAAAGGAAVLVFALGLYYKCVYRRRRREVQVAYRVERIK